MAIQKLEEATVRVIGASQVLTDPATVVKELIDNALDANATIIAVEIHANTLDVIQVRDNGHGIPPDDRALVATPNCTSKLVNFSDLKDVGGASLGFRGQALASAAELSGSMTLSTRVDGESVAAVLRIDHRGQIISQERTSLPVGTTVRITDFIKANPVRRQQALKSTEKVLKRIKQTLQAYAFVRPRVRFSLRVLKAKNEKGNWMYAPKAGGGVEDAAMKVVGSACVSQCDWSVTEEHGFTLHALLPRPDAIVSKISGLGAFVSLDRRPLSASRGTLKHIIKVFRESLKAGSTGLEDVKEPFILLQIECPGASYDPNVEPAKDDVLFEEPDKLIELARRLFVEVYASPRPTEETVGSVVEVQSRPSPQLHTPVPQQQPWLEDEDDLPPPLEPSYRVAKGQRSSGRNAGLGPPQLQTPAPTSDARSTHEDADGGEEVTPVSVFRSNMYGCDEEDLDLLDARRPTGCTDADFEELRRARKDVNVSNPWVMAKLHSTNKQAEIVEIDESATVQPSDSPDRRHNTLLEHADEDLPVAQRSSLPPSSRPFHPSNHVPDLRLARDGRMIGPSPLPPSEVYIPPRRQHDSFDNDSSGIPPSRRQPGYDYGFALGLSDPAAGTPLDAIPVANQRPRRSPQKRLQQGQVNKPFVSPLTDGPPREKVWFDHLGEAGRSRPKRNERYRAPNSNGLVHQGELGDSVENPRPLTPPTRNRDIRDFVGSVDLTGDETAAALVERRKYGNTHQAQSCDAEQPQPPGDNDENARSAKGVLTARGFIPASELAAMEARLGPLEKEPTEPRTKRRKTGGNRPLRDLSPNISGVAEPADDEEFVPVSRATTRRRSRTVDGHVSKVQRTKSSRLPLERVPKGQGMHNVTLSLPTSVRDVSSWAGKVDEDRTLLGFNQHVAEAYDTFALPPDAAEMEDLAAKLDALLINRVSDGEMVQDLGELIRKAFAANGDEKTETADGNRDLSVTTLA
ncbi:hypothetical protein B0A50_04167 [Salinomyces thailandicus]|uniref:DNA mismatch repair protein S5 domain-containing protein n=1 Tax=Salinomyces thailandicus TaxID=706561 RepID=A0A4U0U256_9PEZI|nr:hypothetical protein B0A50_04167 [Salinomyces thailandica]